MSSIEVIPLLKTITGVQTNEDFIYSLAFYYDDNVTPVSLTGIAFTANIGNIATLSTTANSIIISGSDDNILTMSVLASGKEAWGAGEYSFSLLASDGIYTRDIFAQSSLIVGAPFITYVVPLFTGGNMPQSLATYLPPALANLINLQNQIQQMFLVSPLTISQTITQPGIYLATETGQTFTLPAYSVGLGNVTIKDGTGLSNPNFNVAGVIEGSQVTINYNRQNMSYTFCFNATNNSWAII